MQCLYIYYLPELHWLQGNLAAAPEVPLLFSPDSLTVGAALAMYRWTCRWVLRGDITVFGPAF